MVVDDKASQHDRFIVVAHTERTVLPGAAGSGRARNIIVDCPAAGYAVQAGSGAGAGCLLVCGSLNTVEGVVRSGHCISEPL